MVVKPLPWRSDEYNQRMKEFDRKSDRMKSTSSTGISQEKQDMLCSCFTGVRISISMDEQWLIYYPVGC